MNSPVTMPPYLCDCHGNLIQPGMMLQAVTDGELCKIVCLPGLYVVSEEAMEITNPAELQKLPYGSCVALTELNNTMWEIKP